MFRRQSTETGIRSMGFPINYITNMNTYARRLFPAVTVTALAIGLCGNVYSTWTQLFYCCTGVRLDSGVVSADTFPTNFYFRLGELVFVLEEHLLSVEFSQCTPVYSVVKLILTKLNNFNVIRFKQFH